MSEDIMYRCSLTIGLVSLTLAGAIVACGPEVFPKCEDPTKPCPSAPPIEDPVTPPPLSSADVADACVLACENLRSPRVNCPEGFGSIGGEPCAMTCMIASRLRALPLACWVAAKSAVDARSCGSLRCVK